MLEIILGYTVLFLLIVMFVLMVYLELFLIRRLYSEICLAKKKEKISSWWGYHKRLKCLKGFATVEPYAKRVNKALLLHKIDQGIAIVLVAVVVVYKILGYGNAPQKCTEVTEEVTVTIAEGNQTRIKKYKSLKEMFK